jgi:23S rRNA pseudouridine1911/1915/1917 synthase
MRPLMTVLYEDNHVLVVDKPAGLATQGVAEGAPSVVTQAKEYLKHKHQKPGNVYLGVVSRLDQSVSGLLVLARTSKAAARLTSQFQAGTVSKTYLALVERPPRPAAGELSHWLVKNDRERRIEVVRPRARGAQHARLRYQTLSKQKRGTLLEVELLTGRKHQIRAQLAAIGCPIVGDRKYGSRKPFIPGAIALACVRLEFMHPVNRIVQRFTLPPPEAWELEQSG